METKEKKASITVQTTVKAPIDKAWEYWTQPEHITRWNQASDDWHTPHAENDLRTGGKFSSRMEARDGSVGFDMSGTYDKVEPQKLIEYSLDDGRRVSVKFESKGDETLVTETFEAEDMNSHELQKSGWQAILDSFSRYASERAGKLMHFETRIKAPADKVYETMIGDKGYREWTKVFNETSHFKGDWKKGSKIHFVGEENGKKMGMVSRIRENIPGKYVSIEHLGMLDGDKEVTSGAEVEKWAGMLENYTFTADGRETVVQVDMDSNEEMRSYFETTWPKALERLKQVCETAK